MAHLRIMMPWGACITGAGAYTLNFWERGTAMLEDMCLYGMHVVRPGRTLCNFSTALLLHQAEGLADKLFPTLLVRTHTVPCLDIHFDCSYWLHLVRVKGT